MYIHLIVATPYNRLHEQFIIFIIECMFICFDTDMNIYKF